ncbi:MAG: iron ABC transporter permease [Clostridium sp.]
MKKKLWVLTGITIVFFLISICVGRFNMSISELVDVIFLKDPSSVQANLFYNIRLPRTLLVLICGGALALSGTVFQSIFRNPLISPDVLGVSSGCSVGAVIAILLTGKSVLGMQTITFLAGIIVVLIAISMAKFMRSNKILALIISGIVISSLASSIIMMLKYVADPYKELPTIEFWLMGGFHNASWENINTILPLIFLSGTILFLLRWRLKVMTLGDEEAMSLGVNVNLVRIISILCSTVLVSTVVSVAGLVSWIGLIAPHIIKTYAGDDITKTLPLSIMAGGSLLLAADIASRTLFPAELPISILTSFIGAIFLFYIVLKRRV